jgi:hypothetical protein
MLRHGGVSESLFGAVLQIDNLPSEIVGGQNFFQNSGAKTSPALILVQSGDGPRHTERAEATPKNEGKE